MRNFIISLVLIFTIFTGFISAQDSNKVYYSLFMEQSFQFGTVDTRIDSGSFKEGEHFIIPDFVLPSSPVDFSKYQELYDALVGGKFSIDYGALDNDIILKIFIRNLDPNSNKYLSKGKDNDTLFAYFEMRIWELPDSNFVPEDSNYYFNEGYKARLCIPKTPAFYNFLKVVGIDSTDTLGFAYFEGDDWTASGIETIDKGDSVCFEGIHLSKVGGGRGNIYSVTGIKIENLGEISNEFELYQNYPNPFNPVTTIRYSIPGTQGLQATPEKVQLTIYNVLGKKVTTLVNTEQPAGTYQVTFDANGLPSGIYFYKLNAGNYTKVRKMILMK